MKEIKIPEGYEARIEGNKVILELKESEDERTRKSLLEFLNDVWHMGKNANFDKWGKADCADWISYLEKKRESTWTEEDDNFERNVLPRILNPSKWTLEQNNADKHYLEEFVNRQKNKSIEKQKEQKPVDYTEELEKCRKNPLYFFDKYVKIKMKPAEWSDSAAKEMFIKALERTVEQTKKGYELTDCDKHSWWEDFKAYSGIKPAEWSEEDKKFIKELCNLLASIAKNNYVGGYYAPDLVSKLQSLRPQPITQPITYVLDEPLGYDNDLNPIYPPINHWKPSDEQIRPLEYAIEYFKKKKNDTTYLESLLNDLNKL